MDEQIFTPIGMRKDLNKGLVAQNDSQYLYDARNIRFTTRGDETTGSIINERGTKFLRKDIKGAYLGHAVLKDKIVLFTHNNNPIIKSPTQEVKPEAPIVSGEDLNKRYYIWKLLGGLAKTFSGTITLKVLRTVQNSDSKETIWSKVLTKEDIAKQFRDGEVVFNLGIIEGNYDNNELEFEIEVSDSKYSISEEVTNTNNEDYTVTKGFYINFKDDITKLYNIPVCIDNSIENPEDYKAFSGGQIRLKVGEGDPIYKDFELNYDPQEYNVYWFEDISISGDSEPSIDLIFNPPGSRFFSSEVSNYNPDNNFSDTKWGIVGAIINRGEIKIEKEKSVIKDSIYLIEVSSDATVKELFSGDLGFSIDHPLETIPYYEGTNIQKVYWTDGINPTRVINIAKDIDPYDNTQFDFVPSLKLCEEVQINKVAASSEGRPAGVVQYIFTYVNKFAQESNPFFVSSQYYASYPDRGGSPEDTVYSSFKLEIINPDRRFDYIKVYVVERTTLNGTPSIYSLPLIDVGDNRKVSIIDSGINYTAEDTEVLYPAYSVAATTINVKDYALFLGGIKKIYNEQDEKLSNILSLCVNQIRSSVAQLGDTSKSKITLDKFQLDFSSEEISVFKDLNTYRLGVQFQFKDGSFSQPYFVKDITKNRYNGGEKEIRQIFSAFFEMDLILDDNTIDYRQLLDSIIGIRPLIVYPRNSQKKALYQGVLNPTVFNPKDRNENAPFTQPSWFFRPFNVQSTSAGGSTTTPDNNTGITTTSPVYYMILRGKDLNSYLITDNNKNVSYDRNKWEAFINSQLRVVSINNESIVYATAKIIGIGGTVYKSKNTLYNLSLFITDLTNNSLFSSIRYANGYKIQIYDILNAKWLNLKFYWSNTGNIYGIEGNAIDSALIRLPNLQSTNWNGVHLNGVSVTKGVLVATDIRATPLNLTQVHFAKGIAEYDSDTNVNYKYFSSVHTGDVEKDGTPNINSLWAKYSVLKWSNVKDAKDDEVQSWWYNDNNNEYNSGAMHAVYIEHPPIEGYIPPVDKPNSEGTNPDLSSNQNFFREYKHMYQLPLASGCKAEIQSNVSQVDLSYTSVNSSYFIDASLVTFNSPDCELENIFNEHQYELNIIGAYKIGDIKEKLDITVSSSLLEQSKSGYTPPGAALIQNTGYIAKPCWFDGVFFDYYGDSDNNNNLFYGSGKDHSWPGYVIYPWHKTGSLNNQNTTTTKSGMYVELSSKLQTKVSYHILNCSSLICKDLASFPINYKVCYKENTGLSTIKSGYLDEDIVYYNNIDTTLTISGQGAQTNNNPGFPIYIGKGPGVKTLFKPNELQEAYNNSYFDTISSAVASLSGTGNIYSSNPISMRYRSNNHLLLSLNKDTVNFLNVLPYYNKVEKQYNFYKNGNKYTKGFFYNEYTTLEIGNYLLCGEICNANPDPLQSNDYKSESWLIGGKVSPVTKVFYTENYTNESGEASSVKYCSIYASKGIKWTEGDYFYQKYECLKTSAYSLEDENQIVEIAVFPCQCQVNLEGRYDKNKRANFNVYLTSNNFNRINPVYSQSNNLFVYRKVDQEQFNTKNLENSISWSLNKANNDIKDNWLRTSLIASVGVDGSCGSISAIRKDESGDLIVFQDTGISTLMYNNQTIQTTDSGTIEIANNNKVNGVKYISSIIGCSNKWAIQPSKVGITFADSKTKTLWLLAKNNLIDLATQFGMKSWFLNNSSNKDWANGAYSNFKSYYDVTNNEFYLINADTCLCYGIEGALSFYDYENTPAISLVNNKHYCFKSIECQDSSGDYCVSMYEMFSGQYNHIFGEYKNSSVTYLANKYPAKDKTFTNFEYRCDMYSVDEGSDTLNGETFSTIRAYNEYQDSGDVPLDHTGIKSGNIAKKFRIWRGLIPRDCSNRRDRIRNTWMHLTFTKSFESNVRFELHDMIIKSV